MRNSLYILVFFASGVMLGYQQWIPAWLNDSDPSTYALYALMLLVGISIGADKGALLLIRSQGIRLLLVPLATIAGTFGGVLLVTSLAGNLSLREGLAVGAGFGYYSLSSIIITQLHSEALGVVALLSNVIREILTLLLAPVMVVMFGRIAPIASAGATSMDTTLPIITAASGKEYTIIALFHGIILTILVPMLVSLILTF